MFQYGFIVMFTGWVMFVPSQVSFDSYLMPVLLVLDIQSCGFQTGPRPKGVHRGYSGVHDSIPNIFVNTVWFVALTACVTNFIHLY